MHSRRHFLKTTGSLGAGLAMSGLVPGWARTAGDGNLGIPSLTGTQFDLTVDKFAVRIDGHVGQAVGVNGSLPAPLIRFREGDEITLNVTNNLSMDTSIHWHGLLVPFYMDGVPGVTFPGIKPGEIFTYKYAVPQSGTYWYHSHSGLQEQQGHYGPIIIDPKGADPVAYDREYVLVLSDWSFDPPHTVFSRLKKNSEVYNRQERTVPEFFADARTGGLVPASMDRGMWGLMRMSPTDIADATGAIYTYLINGHSTADNWNAVFNTGERVRLRIINASAMTIFNFRIPGLPMTVVASDGLNVKPLETDEFQIGVAETYDVIVSPNEDRAFAMVAESIDRSGMAVATLGPNPGMRAEPPALRSRPTLTMRDMGMAAHAGHGGGHETAAPSTDHAQHGGADPHAGHIMEEHQGHQTGAHAGSGAQAQRHDHKRGVGVDMVATAPVYRLNEPGLGLEDVPHRTLTYADLRSLEPNPDRRAPMRELELHLTGNMQRYMWSFDGVKFSEVVEPIIFHEGERIRLTLVNDTMMSHPIHLHGMFFEVVNGAHHDRPRKHTIIVKPGEKLSLDVSAEHVGDWAFHCHLLFHMHAGMMQVVSVLPRSEDNAALHQVSHGPDHSSHAEEDEHAGHNAHREHP